MEKRRRARINNCLNELKALILDAMKKDVSELKLKQGECTSTCHVSFMYIVSSIT